MDRRFLVVVHAGDRSRHPAWLPAGPRNWDLVVCYAGNDPHRYPADGDGMVRIDRAGARWPTLAGLLADTREAWQHYEQLWLPPDDLAITPEAIDQLFAAASAQGLDHARPLSNGEDLGAVAPLFSAGLLTRLLPRFEGADVDAMARDWARLAASAGGRVGSLDLDAPRRHAAAAASTPPTLSVIVPSFNRAEILARCLAQLAAQTLAPERYEVIVVDDGSTDATPQVLAAAARSQGVIALHQPNLGPAAARNHALARARGEWLLFLNDDALLEPQALEIHLAEHARRGPRAAVLGAFTMHPDFVRLDRPLGHCLDHSDLVFEYPFLRPGQPYGHREFYTCNLSIGREFVLRHGGFDEGFVRMGAEDIELGMRLEREGCQVFYRPDAVARHAHRLDAPGLARMFQFRGRGGVHLFTTKPQFQPHYAEMPASRRDSFLALDARLQPLLRRLDDAIARFDARGLATASGTPVALHQRSTGIDFSSLWSWPDSAIERMLGRLIETLEPDAAPAAGAPLPTLQEAAGRLYPALQFVKWYHDTLGLLSSPELLPYLDTLQARRRGALRQAA